MKTNTTRAGLGAALCLCVLLTACGGGGGGSTSTTSSSSPNPSSSGSTGTLSSPQYASGSAELAAFNQLNTLRQECGFPALSENTLLDQAAANHLAYMQDNKITPVHTEIQGNPGYTGATLQQRAQAVGYPFGGVGEIIDADSSNIGGALAATALTTVPYHAALAFAPFTDFGAAYGPVVMGPTTTYYTAEITLGYQTRAASYGATPLTFPCEGATGLPTGATGENPTPTINGQAVAFPIGTPILIEGNATDTVLLASGQMTDPSGNVITLDLLDSANDSNHEIPPWAAAAFPASSLQPNTTYSVTLTGTIDGTAFSRNFSFATGSQGLV